MLLAATLLATAAPSIGAPAAPMRLKLEKDATYEFTERVELEAREGDSSHDEEALVVTEGDFVVTGATDDGSRTIRLTLRRLCGYHEDEYGRMEFDSSWEEFIRGKGEPEYTHGLH